MKVFRNAPNGLIQSNHLWILVPQTSVLKRKLTGPCESLNPWDMFPDEVWDWWAGDSTTGLKSAYWRKTVKLVRVRGTRVRGTMDTIDSISPGHSYIFQLIAANRTSKLSP